MDDDEIRKALERGETVTLSGSTTSDSIKLKRRPGDTVRFVKPDIAAQATAALDEDARKRRATWHTGIVQALNLASAVRAYIDYIDSDQPGYDGDIASDLYGKMRAALAREELKH